MAGVASATSEGTSRSNVVVYGIPKRITYAITGRFTSPRKAAGTLQVSTLWTHPDGSQTSCVSGPLTWSECAWYLELQALPGLRGLRPFELSGSPRS